jgi:outer membrane protein assembly factor BamE (lipoprotein component of BamABCDE complex)
MTAALRPVAFAAVLLLAACATTPYAPTAVRPGDARDDVLRIMGPPTATYTMPDGHVRLEYNRMPAGRQTFMVDLDAQGRVARWENVLDENHFAAIQPGMDANDVLRLIGPPTYASQYRLPEPGITWLYRFETIQRCILFEVAFDKLTGKVLSGDYPPDPGCPDEHW